MHSIVQSIVKSVVWLLHAIYMQGYLDGHVMQCRPENNNVKPIFHAIVIFNCYGQALEIVSVRKKSSRIHYNLMLKTISKSVTSEALNKSKFH